MFDWLLAQSGLFTAELLKRHRVAHTDEQRQRLLAEPW